MSEDELLDDDFFAEESGGTDRLPESHAFKVLIVDDDQEIHSVTTLALSDFDFEGRPLEFIHAHSAWQARQILEDTPDIAVALLDVVMESDHAGLELARWIREDLRNESIRLVLRTGQPGQAPEQQVIRDFDINDYKAKTELTAQKLYTLMYTALRAYEHILILEKNKLGMEKVIDATKNIIGEIGFIKFVQASLNQLVNLINIEDSVVISLDCQAITIDSSGIDIICATGKYSENEEYLSLEDLPFYDLVRQAMVTDEPQYGENEIVMICQSKFISAIFYVGNFGQLSDLDKHLLKLFAENITIALENTSLNDQIKNSQSEVIYRLTEVVESRTRGSGNHVRRVAKYAELLGRLYGLSDELCETLLLAAPLHDIGKVGIPDSVLQKPGKLNDEEWEVMQTHAETGQYLLEGSKQSLLETGAIIAGTHHERWDGKGYPKGLKGEDIPIVGRVTALADTFDALCSKRCYKEPWKTDEVLEYIKSESGKLFEPRLVDLMMDNLDEFMKIKESLKDSYGSE